MLFNKGYGTKRYKMTDKTTKKLACNLRMSFHSNLKKKTANKNEKY